MDDTLKLKVVCRDLPGIRFGDDGKGEDVKAAVHLGIQCGEEVIHQVPGDRTQVTFHPEFQVKRRPDGTPSFLGPYAKGSAKDRFFYLSWGEKLDSGDFRMFRRLKIFLRPIRWTDIKQSVKSDEPIVVRLQMKDDKGGPTCGTPNAGAMKWEL